MPYKSLQLITTHKNYSHARYPFIPPYNTHIVATHSMLLIGDYLNYVLGQ